MEFGATARLASGTTAALRFGVDPQDAVDKAEKLRGRWVVVLLVMCACAVCAVLCCVVSGAAMPLKNQNTQPQKKPTRLATLEAAVLEQRAAFGARVVRRVPVEWMGVASEVCCLARRGAFLCGGCWRRLFDCALLSVPRRLVQLKLILILILSYLILGARRRRL